MFTATFCVTDIDYIPFPVYLAAYSGEKAIVDIFLQREDCPIECIVNVYLLKATGHQMKLCIGFMKKRRKLDFTMYGLKVLKS